MDKSIILASIYILLIACKQGNQKSEECNISLAEWSLHKNLYDSAISHLDFPRIAADSFGIYHLEYVSGFFQETAEDNFFLQKMKDSCAKYGTQSLLIMVDNEGLLGDTSENARTQSVRNHIKWLKAAKYLDCYAIRVNGNGFGSATEVQSALVRSLRELADSAKAYELAIVVENHGMPRPGIHWDPDTYSANGKWLSESLKKVGRTNCGALPDFGNFHTNDPYQGVQLLLPYTMGISAKTFDFDSLGEETSINYKQMFDIINKSDFCGYYGIEYEGNGDSSDEYRGIRKTKKLLERYCAPCQLK